MTPPSGWYVAKAALTVEAHANPGYAFGFWAGALRGTTNLQTLVLRGPRSVTACFSAMPKKDFTVISAQGAPAPPVGTYQYSEGVTVNANCGPNPYPGGTGIQYVCTGHLGTGNLTDGPETSVSFVITVDSSVTWLWQTQYYLTIVVSPLCSGTVTCVPAGPWYNSGAVVTLMATPHTGYVFTNWSCDLSGSNNPETLIMDGPKSVIASFRPPISFNVISVYGAPVPPVGTYYYFEGEIVNANCGPTPYSGGSGIRYVCTGHLGTGDLTDGAQTSVSFVITMNSSVTWLWKMRYYLRVEPADIGAPVGAGWCDAGTTATWSVTSPWPSATGVQYVTSPTSGSVLMDAPKTITVSWTTQYYLTIDSAYGDPVGAGWYNSGATASWSVTSPYPGAEGVRYTALDPISDELLMDEPKTVTVTWTSQYELTTSVLPKGGGTITCLPESASGGWYDAGTSIQLTAVPNTGYKLTEWSGDLSGTNNPETLIMDAPKTIIANFVYTGPWAKTYGGVGTDNGWPIQQTSDGGYIVAGSTGSFGAGNGDFWVLKLNGEGAVCWQKVYGGTQYEHAYSIQQTSDGGYIVAGITYSFGTGGGDSWVLKLASDGTVPFSPASGAQVIDTNAVPVDTNCTVANTTATVTNTSATVTNTNCTVTDTNATVQQQAP